jgi:hypothetical protein
VGLILTWVTLCIACSSSPTSHLSARQVDLNQVDLSSLASIHGKYQNEESQLSQDWISCLEPLFNTTQSVNSASDAAHCYSLLNRPAQDNRPEFLNRGWLILKAEEHLRPSLKIQTNNQRHLGPINHALNRGAWTLSVTLLRLPPVSSRLHKSINTLPTRGTPNPLSDWSESTVDNFSISEWTMNGVHTQRRPLAPDTHLKDLPSPRVGQVMHLSLILTPPKITRGAWALHLPLWFKVPTLKRDFSLHIPKGLSLSYFGIKPQVLKNRGHSRLVRWKGYMLPSGEGGDIYLTTTSTWSALHTWLWKKLTPALMNYTKVMTQLLNTSSLEYFLHRRSPIDIHRWLRNTLVYSPNQSKPYEPLSIYTLLKQKFGDCKEFSALGHALLSLQGQTSFIALTSTKPIPPIAFHIPSIGWFDHVLLWVPSESALKLAQLNGVSTDKILDLGLTKHHWFDGTSPTLQPRIDARVAYVLISKDQGVWIPLEMKTVSP